jgi:hypothetical protein
VQWPESHQSVSPHDDFLQKMVGAVPVSSFLDFTPSRAYDIALKKALLAAKWEPVNAMRTDLIQTK